MPTHSTVLHMIFGKIASGKSTLAQRLAEADRTVLLAEDAWLRSLYGDEMRSVADFLRCSKALRHCVGPHVVDLLRAGVSVVLDFQANTVESRAWMRSLFEQAGSAHLLHVLDVPDALCLERLRARNAAGVHPFSATEAQFWEVSKHVVLPGAEEGFETVRHG